MIPKFPRYCIGNRLHSRSDEKSGFDSASREWFFAVRYSNKVFQWVCNQTKIGHLLFRKFLFLEDEAAFEICLCLVYSSTSSLDISLYRYLSRDKTTVNIRTRLEKSFLERRDEFWGPNSFRKILLPKDETAGRADCEAVGEEGEEGVDEEKPAVEQRLPLIVNATILLLFCCLGGILYLAAGYTFIHLHIY